MTKHWFLVETYSKRKGLTLFFIALIMGQFFFLYKKIPNFPFLLYAMYSHPIDVEKEYTTFQLKVNGDEQNLFRIANCPDEFLYYQFWKYYRLKQNKDPIEKTVCARFGIHPDSTESNWFVQQLTNQPQDIAAFLPWLSRYLRQILHTDVQKIELYVLTCAYNTQGTVEVLSKSLIGKYSE